MPERLTRAEIEASKIISLDELEVSDSVSMLLNSIPAVSPLSLEEATILSGKLKAGRDPKTGKLNDEAKLARDAMVFSVKGMVIDLAYKNLRPGMSVADSVQECLIAAQRAAEKYEPERGFLFNTFAHDAILWAASKQVQRNRRFQNQHNFSDIEEADTDNDFNLEDRVDVTAINGLQIEKGMEIQLIKNEIANAVDTLMDPRHKFVLRCKIGIKEDGSWGDSMTLDEIADILHVTRERVRQIQTKALSYIDDDRLRILIRNLIEPVKEPMRYKGPVET